MSDCTGYQILDAESAQACRVHCPGCAWSASDVALASIRSEAGTWMRVAASNATECERQRDRAVAAEALALTNGEARERAEARAKVSDEIAERWHDNAVTIQGERDGLRKKLAEETQARSDDFFRLAAKCAAAEAERDELRGRVARLENELRGVVEDVDGECLCDGGPDCLCGGDGEVDGDPLEFGCAGCWAVRMRQVADGVDWPPRVLAAAIPKGTPTARK